MDPKRFAIQFSAPEKKYRVNVPPDLSSSGKRERYFFSKKSEADAFIAAEVARLRNDGNAGAALSRVERDIAAKAFQQIRKAFPESNPSDLLQAVREYIENRDNRSRSKSFKDGYEEWMARAALQTRKGKPTSRHYLNQIRHVLPRLKPLHEILLCDLTSEKVESALSETLNPTHKTMRNLMVRILNACFTYAQKRKWLQEIPIGTESKADIGKKEPEILTPDQVARLLATCTAIDRELLGFYVMALFAAVRPTDELAKLQWNHVFADGGKRIHIPATVSKTGRIRYVDISPTLKAWLDYIEPPRIGPVTPKKQHVKRRREVQRAAGIHPWPHDVMRHSYASYWMTVHRDEDRCRDNMGHQTKDQLNNHYRQHTTEEDAQAFWALVPKAISKISALANSTSEEVA